MPKLQKTKVSVSVQLGIFAMVLKPSPKDEVVHSNTASLFVTF